MALNSGFFFLDLHIQDSLLLCTQDRNKHIVTGSKNGQCNDFGVMKLFLIAQDRKLMVIYLQ